MDCRRLLLCSVIVTLTILVAAGEGRKKKVVIHVPYKVKKIKHTHTIYKTIHHHHHDRHPFESTNHEVIHQFNSNPGDDHEHFHHMHLHDEKAPHHGQHAGSAPIPEFLPPDVQMDLPIELPDLPLDVAAMPNRHIIPLYRRV